MLQFNPNLYPPGGYAFTDRDGTRHFSDSWKNLIEKVTAYRQRAGFGVGNVWDEIQAQVCAAAPGHCRESNPQAPQPSRTRNQSGGIPSFNQRVLEWLNGIMGRKRVNALPRVSPEEAQRRASMCIGCPRQTPLTESCQSCLIMTKTARKIILKGGPSQHQNLNPCGALGEDCQVSVYIEQPPVEAAGQPAECWRRGK